MKEYIEKIKNMKELQQYSITDAYMLGLYNGIELCLATLEHRNPDYKERQDVKERKSLLDEIAKIINSFSVENESDTPDFLLSRYLVRCLENYAEIVKGRDKWYSFMPWATYEKCDNNHKSQTNNAGASNS